MFDVGDKVVYPHHGAGTVVKKEKREVLGQTREYLTIQILHNDMTVNVPAESAEKVGLRTVIDEDLVNTVVKALTGGSTEMPKNWNRRFKHNRDKMKTGDIFELAEVVKNLSLRDHEKGLSTGEKQMFVKAKKILASELMYAKEHGRGRGGRVARGRPRRNRSVGPRRRSRRRRPRPRPSSARAPKTMSVWALLVAAGAGERLGEDRPKAFVGLGELPLLAEPLRRLDESELDRRDRRRRAAGLGGAGDPARRGARGDEGRRARSPAARRAPSRCGPRSPRCRRTRSSVLVHDAARPLVTDEVIERVLAPLSEGWDGAVPALPLAGHGQARRRRPRRRDARPRRSRRGADAAGVPRRRAAAGLCRRPRRRDRLRVARRGARRPRQGRRGRPAAAEGDDARPISSWSASWL